MAVKFLDKTGLGYFWSKIKAWCNATFAAITHSHAWSAITGKPTTVSGYGITDAKIANGTITLGSNSITPLTSHQDISGKVNKSGDTMTGMLTHKVVSGVAHQIINTGITKGSDSISGWTYIPFIDSSEAESNEEGRLGYVGFNYNKKAIYGTLTVYRGLTATDKTKTRLSIGYDASGNVFTEAPTPATADNSTKIATTAFVKAQGYTTATGHTHSYLPLSGGTLTGNLEIAKNNYPSLTQKDTDTTGTHIDFTHRNSSATALFNIRTYTGETQIGRKRDAGGSWYEGSEIILYGSGDITVRTNNGTDAYNLVAKASVSGGELVWSGIQSRMAYGNYGVIFRNDGSNFYLLKTASGSAASGSWDSTRPLTVNLSTGICNINGNAATASKVAGGISASHVGGCVYGNALVSSNVTSYGAIWNAATKNTRVSMATYPSNNDLVYLLSCTNANVSSNTNTIHHSVTWDANNGTLTNYGQIIVDRVANGAGGSLRIKGNAINYAISLQDTGVTKGTALGSTRYIGIDFYGNTYSDYKNRFGVIENQVTGTTSKLIMAAYNSTTADNTGTCAISVRVDASGNSFAEAPTPASDANDTRIATTKWVKDRAYITSSSNITGTAANVTGTVAIANGGTGATTRLNAVKALTNENVGTGAQHFLTITDSWGKAGFTSVANAKTVLGLKSAAYTESSAYAAASHTHSYLPLGGGTMTGTITASEGNIIKRSVTNNILSIYGGTSSTDGARFELYGGTRSTNPGSFLITASINSSNNKQLLGKPDGTLTWGGTAISLNGHTHSYLPLAGGTLTGSVYIKDTNIPDLTNSGTSTTWIQTPFVGVYNTNTISVCYIKSWFRGSDGSHTLEFGLNGTKAYNSDWANYGTVNNDSNGKSWHTIAFQKVPVSSAMHLFFGPTAFQNNKMISLGANHANYRWNGVYTSVAVNVSSDRRLKHDISDIPDDLLDAWDDVELKQFIFNDRRRFHTGTIAQQVEEACISHGVDISKYGLWCYSNWETDPETNTPAGDEYSIRYEEFLIVEAAYQRRKNKILEKRISELETQVQSMLQILKNFKGA